MMIEHVALWVKNLEASRQFYEMFFGGKAGGKYINPRTGFQSYFITFHRGARLEIMQLPGLLSEKKDDHYYGYAHLAFSVGSKEAVDHLTNLLREHNYRIVSEPRQTGDGYYESCIMDLDNNRIEITI